MNELCSNINIPDPSVMLQGEDAWIQQTRLFQEWQTMYQAIIQHKWYESEKAGHDIGWENARNDWMRRFSPRKRIG